MAEETNFSQELTKEGFAKSFAGEYTGSSLQKETYERLQQNDRFYQRFITENYGYYENYLTQKRVGQASSLFDPTIDFVMNVTVITKEHSYKSDHISSQEVIMEALSGVCTITFMKVDGSVGKIVGSLETDYIPPTEHLNRFKFFSPLAKNRIVMWDITKQGWRSFYMENVIKFVRDDTTDLE